ncbi:MAG TPA: DUF2911 domain-containing protein [Phycisphaerae bacterium]|nr:DUF2911 domain-containing protein [Phycisphaerae bacterium]
MKRSRTLALLTAGIMLATLPLFAQQKRKSPHETISRRIDGKVVMVVYGRPYTKDPNTGEARKIWGSLVPYGKVWRLGADEATLLVTEAPLEFSGTEVPAGAYSLYMLPDETGTSKLIINKQVGQWGTVYDEKQDLARVDLTKGSVDSKVDQLTMAVEKGKETGGVLRITWESSTFSVPFTVKK